MNTAAPVSATETTGLASPPVVTVLAARPVAVAPLIAAAAPPPAIMASVQVMAGLKSAVVEAMMAVPAMPAKGTAKVSSRLSIKGTR